MEKDLEVLNDWLHPRGIVHNVTCYAQLVLNRCIFCTAVQLYSQQRYDTIQQCSALAHTRATLSADWCRPTMSDAGRGPPTVKWYRIRQRIFIYCHLFIFVVAWLSS